MLLLWLFSVILGCGYDRKKVTFNRKKVTFNRKKVTFKSSTPL